MYSCPSVHDVVADAAWPDEVSDWLVFWALVKNWLRFVQFRRRKVPIVDQPLEEWLQLGGADVSTACSYCYVNYHSFNSCNSTVYCF